MQQESHTVVLDQLVDRPRHGRAAAAGKQHRVRTNAPQHVPLRRQVRQAGAGLPNVRRTAKTKQEAKPGSGWRRRNDLCPDPKKALQIILQLSRGISLKLVRFR